MKERIENFNKLIDERNARVKEIHEQINHINKEYELKTEQFLDFKGKYIKIKEENSYDYIYVNESFRYKDMNDRVQFLLRGVGFSFNLSNYIDACWANFDAMNEHDIPIHNIDSAVLDLKTITIISKEEFISAFENMLNKTKQKFYEHLEN